ncbi:MAG: protein jag [Clostridiales bacterium]|nr:protein jag [Clostridiales bacterium]
MSQIVEKTGKSVEEAIQFALEELMCSRDEAEIEVIAEPAKGLWGIIGTKDARIRAWKRETGTEHIDTELSDTKLSDVEGPLEQEDKTYRFISDVTRLMGIETEIDRKENEEAIQYSLNGPRMGLIIGRRGETLDALQYLSSIVSGRDREYPRKRILVDAEDYRKRREETLVRLATRLATKAKRSGRRVVLEPMNPQERRVIHTALEKDPGVSSLSEGEEPYRRLVIYPLNNDGRRGSQGGNDSWDRGSSDEENEYGDDE